MNYKKPVFYEYDIEKTVGPDLISIGHADDCNSEVIELRLVQNGEQVDVSDAEVTARYVMRKSHILLGDNVACTVNENGNILVPFDNSVISGRKGDMDVEVSVSDGSNVLTLQFPLWVRVRGSVLDNAEISETSQGKAVELLEQAAQELQRVSGFTDTSEVFEILDSALSGDPSNIPALLVDNTVDQTHNPDGHYILYYIDSDEVRHNIFDISEYFVGKTSETVTKTVTLFDGTAINETLSEANSNLRYVIWGTTGAHLSFEAGKTYHIEITCTEVNLSSVTSVRLMHYPNGSTITNYQIFAPVVSGNVLTCDYTVPENGNGLLLRLNAKAGAQNVSLKVTTEEETEIAVSNSDALPSYCADEIGRVKKAVLDQANYGDVVFGVFTDLHFAENDSEASAAQKWNAIKIMRRLADETILDFVIQGGDLLTNGYYENDT